MYQNLQRTKGLVDKVFNQAKEFKVKNIIITDDLSMKALKYSIEDNTKKSFKAGCNLALHCNGNLNQMIKVAKNSPNINKFILKKTSQFNDIIS